MVHNGHRGRGGSVTSIMTAEDLDEPASSTARRLEPELLRLYAALGAFPGWPLPEREHRTATIIAKSKRLGDRL